MTQGSATQRSNEQAIRPFPVANVPEAELTDLRKRINATRWPERETVTDATQGVQLATMQALARYWATDYDWRKCEAKLQSLPNFLTEIDGLDIHFIRIRSKHENALPLIVTHGWPGSITEQLKIIDPLTNPTAHGGNASDAFHIVVPSMPGYGFSGKPTTTGWGPERIASAWAVLMKQLGYSKFVAQGGDWGAVITDLMGVQAPAELLGIHTNMPGAVPADIYRAVLSGAPMPPGFSDDEKPSSTSSTISSLRCASPRSRVFITSTSSPTTPFFSVKTGRRTSRLNSSPCCARSQTSTRFVQPMRSRLRKLGSS